MSAPSVAGPTIISLGCRLNIAESETIRAMLGDRDEVVVNSCAVTAEAVKRSRQAVRQAWKRHPGRRITVTGCAATIAPEAFAGMAEVARVVANPAKLLPESWDAPAPVAARFGGHARAFVEVQNGCDHDCTFCIIPAGRGPARSRPAGTVIEEIAGLVAAGHREVVLTGVDLTSYGPDLPGRQTLGGLVQRILKHVPNLPRLRLSSLDSIEIDGALLECLTGEPRVMPHVHLSLQAGDDMILKRMKRRHRRADAVRLVERLKAARPEIAIGADLIAGFPTESETMFANTAALIADCDIVHAHIFPFSPREGTPAARMPQVDPNLVRERAARLRAIAGQHRAQWLEGQVETRQRALIERPGDRGHTGHFAEVRLAPAMAEIGAVAEVTITGVDGEQLIGVLS